MTVVAGECEKNNIGGNIVLVGIRLDGNGRDLLNWALGRVAEPGDTVLALHVCRKPDTCSSKNPDVGEEKLLNDFLAAYDIFCLLKNVRLIGQIYHEKSIRKVIVRESKSYSAKTLIVGLNNNLALGNPVSLAKYCAKKTHPTTNVLAIHNGKIFFRRDAVNKISGRKRNSVFNLQSLLHLNFLNGQQETPSCTGSVESSNELVDNGEELYILEQENSTVKHLNVDESSSTCTSNSVAEAGPSEVGVEDDKYLLDEQILETYSRTDSTLPPMKLLETRPGWPLLKRVVTANVESAKDSKARKVSVVQWVMNLPDRSLPASPLSRNSLDDSQSPLFRKQILESYENGSRNFKDLETMLSSRPSNCHWFTYSDLQTYTRFFSSVNLVGKGGNGRVYKGFLPDLKPIAVKLQMATQEVWKDFLLEVDILTSIQHNFVVPLIGICVKDNYLISVYNFFSNGSLEENLHPDEEERLSLTWNARYNIAIDVAEALNYLHSNHPRSVIHRDVKSSNILLSDEFKPMLSDFGLAMWEPAPSYYDAQFDVLGTFGYLAPEYLMYGKVSKKIDVYSFGVVLLELLSGRKAIDSGSPKVKESLVMWAMPLLARGDAMNLLDPNVGINFSTEVDEQQVNRMAKAAFLCLNRSTLLRPHMCQILKLLRGEEDEDEWLTEAGRINYEVMDEPLSTHIHFSNLSLGSVCLEEEKEALTSINNSIED